MVKCLLTECYCDPNCIDNVGNTPLALAKNTDVIRLLLQHGAVATDVYKYSQYLPDGSPRETAKSTIAVFMVGDKGAGKSTLTKALMIESEGISRFTARWSKVGGVKTKTAGMECHTIHSPQVGNLSIYDLAGHREFHNAHDTVIRNAVSGPSSGIFLFVIDMSSSLNVLQRTVAYWLSFIQNQISISAEMPPTHAKPHLLAVGSHTDSVKSKTELKEKESIVRSKCESADIVEFVDYVTVDCRYSESSSLTQLRSHILDSHNALQSTCTSSMPFNVHCFHVYLVSKCGDKPGMQLGNLMDIIKSNVLSSKEMYIEFLPQNYIPVLPQNLPALKKVCSDLNKRGIMLFVQAQTVEDSWIIIDKDLLLHKVNGTVFAPDDFTEHRELTRTGIVPYSKICEVFENAIKSKKIDPQLIIHFLIHMEFCQEVKELDIHVLKLVTETHPMHEEERYFLFPALTQPEPPHDLWRPNPLISYSEYSSCWVLQCHGHQHYLSPRFHQVLLLRLAFTHAFPVEPHLADPTCPTLQQACTLWKNGIKWTTTSSVEALVEISDSQVAVVMRCEQGKEKALVRIRTEVVKEVMFAKHEFCSNTVTVEMFIPNPTYPVNCDFTVSITKIAYSISKHEDAALANDHARTPVNLHKLLHFEPFALLPQECLSLLYSPDSQAHTVTPQFIECAASTFSYVSYVDFCKVLNVPLHKVAVDGAYHKAERMFQVWQTQTEGTYQCLRQHMDKHSVFSGRNILVCTHCLLSECALVTMECV